MSYLTLDRCINVHPADLSLLNAKGRPKYAGITPWWTQLLQEKNFFDLQPSGRTKCGHRSHPDGFRSCKSSASRTPGIPHFRQGEAAQGCGGTPEPAEGGRGLEDFPSHHRDDARGRFSLMNKNVFTWTVNLLPTGIGNLKDLDILHFSVYNAFVPRLMAHKKSLKASLPRRREARRS